MGAVALIFSGQGAQYPGMGRGLYEKSAAARAVFDAAEKIRPGTTAQCFSGTDADLTRTENTQPCIYCVDLAAAAALKEEGVPADMLAGFSLGELAALAFSGAVSYEDGFRLVCKRAELMQKAASEVSSGMVAVLKLSDETVITLCKGLNNVYPVNFNCEGQVAVAGARGELERFTEEVREAGGRAVPLKVGAGFHSPFMAEAAERFHEALDGYRVVPPGIPVYSNVSAAPYEGDLKKLLATQIRAPVRWRTAVENMIDAGADTFIEVGPGKTLSRLVSLISGKVKALNVEDPPSLEKTIAEVCISA
jgi:[acyl-carrier-protein] S-malonyltransferase